MTAPQPLALPATLTMDEAAAVAAHIKAELSAGRGVLEIDATPLQTLDSAAVALLLHAQRLATAAGRELRMVGAPQKLDALARLYGVEALLPAAPGSGPAAVSAAP